MSPLRTYVPTPLCDAKNAFLSSKIQLAQGSLAESRTNLDSCEDFDSHSLTSNDDEGNEEDLEVSERTQDEVEDHPQSPPQSPCNMPLKNTDDSDAKSIDLYEITDAVTPTSATQSLSTTRSSSEGDPTEVMSDSTSDSESDSESQPVKSSAPSAQVISKYQRRPKNSKFRIRFSDVKRLSETDFTYVNKYPFQKTDAGFKCGLCSAISNFYNGSSRLWYNMLKHIHYWHIGDHPVRATKVHQRFVEVAPNRFHYGNYRVELIDGNYRCEECGELSAARTRGGRKAAHYNIVKHIIRHHENPSSRTYVCEHCGKVYHTTCGLNQHKAFKHENADSRFPCSECGKTFASRSRTSMHERQVHGVKKKFICEICGKECNQKSNLESHIAFVHDGQKFECNECDKVFGSKFSLNIHRHCHLGTKFTCDVCGMEFSQQCSVKRHKRTAHP